MTTVDYFKTNFFRGNWFPCLPRNVITVSDAYDLWLPLCSDEEVFFVAEWWGTDTDKPLYAGSTRFEFVHGQVSDFKTFEVEIITEPANYRTQLKATDVVLHWHNSDWKGQADD